MTNYVFNHDGFGALAYLPRTDMTEKDAADLLVRPLVDSGITAIDWCTLTTAEHNCRTRHNRGFDGVGINRDIDREIGQVVAHYNSQPLDLLDIVVKHGHTGGLKVYANMRLSHYLNPERLATCPGPHFPSYAGIKKDFRSDTYQGYLIELIEDLLTKGVDGISLDFERKTPFFPPGVDDEEKAEACTRFLGKVRPLTSKPVIVRVARGEEDRKAEGQDPFAWISKGLVDVVIPATHNHEPDTLDWSFDDFLKAAKNSPRPCQIWPQIWPTALEWTEEFDTKHPPEAIIHRTQEIVATGADGAYYFNFCCYDKDGSLFQPIDKAMFEKIGV